MDDNGVKHVSPAADRASGRSGRARSAPATARRRPEPQPATAARTAGNPSDERLPIMGRIKGCKMLTGARPERLVVLEAAGHGSFVRPPELCLPVFDRFVTERR